MVWLPYFLLWLCWNLVASPSLPCNPGPGALSGGYLSHCAQLCATLCHPTHCSPSGSSVHGVSRERILEWVAISYGRGSSRLGGQTQVSCIAGRFFTDGATWEAYLSLESESVTCQLCHTLCYPVDCSPPGFSVHGIPPGKYTRVGNHSLLQGSFPTQGPNPHCRYPTL